MARDFDGSSAFVGLPITSVLRPSLPVSVHAWVKASALVAGGGIFVNNRNSNAHRGVLLQLSDTSGHIEASIGDNDGGTGSASRRSKITSGAAALATGVWASVGCALRGNTDMDVYIDGVDVGGTYSGSGNGLGYNTGIGGRIGTNGAQFFQGVIAEVAFWTVSLSAAEFAALAHGVAAARIRPESLLGYWPLYGVGDPDVDLSANGNNATVNPGTTQADHAPVGPPFPVAT